MVSRHRFGAEAQHVSHGLTISIDWGEECWLIYLPIDSCSVCSRICRVRVGVPSAVFVGLPLSVAFSLLAQGKP